MAKSPYGGGRGGGRRPSKKRGGQPGNVNARASLFLPPAKSVEERREFLDVLAKIEGTDGDERVEILAQLVSAKAIAADRLTLSKIVAALRILDRVRLSSLKINQVWNASTREQLLNAALNEIWRSVHECEQCAAQVDQILAALQLQLIQGGKDVDAADFRQETKSDDES